MHVEPITLISFSPTGTTKTVLEGIAQGLQADVAEFVDLTRPEADAREFPPFHDTLAILGAPVYGGRIPAVAAARFSRLRAKGIPAIIVAVYGNREYEDALLELKDIAIAGGFVPVAGAAFIGEHSFDEETTPIATGRPDIQDMRNTEELARMIRGKMERLDTLGDMPPLHVPGNTPYKDGMSWPPMSPVTMGSLCTKCGACAAACPTAAIIVGDTVVTDEYLCILCTACVKNCPAGARTWQHPNVEEAANWLSTNCHERKEPEFYL